MQIVTAEKQRYHNTSFQAKPTLFVPLLAKSAGALPLALQKGETEGS